MSASTQAAIEEYLSPATSPAGSGQRIKAAVFCLVAAIGTIVLMPSANSAWPQIPAFVPVYQTVVIVVYAVTAYLLWGHFLASRATALLFLGGGCVYTSLILLAQLLSFPGQFAPTGLVSGGPQTTIWLWAFWHLGPPVFMLSSALFEWHSPGHRTAPERASRIGIGALAAVSVLVGMSVAFVTWGHELLVPLNRGNDFSLMTSSGVAPAIQALTVVALVLHWRVTRLKTVMQVWMAVALFALLLDNAITMMGASRFTVGWYVGRFNALLAAAVLLCVYLGDIRALYARLASSAVAIAGQNDLLEARVRERTQELQRAVALAEKSATDRSIFLSSASHDLRQPFQAMRLFQWMLAERVTDEFSTRLVEKLDEAMKAGEEILAALLSVSSLDAGLVKATMARVQVADLLDEVVDEYRPMAEGRGVALSARAAAVWVETDPDLFKRAVMNLVHNALRFTNPGRRVLVTGRRKGGVVRIQVWDQGIGIPADKLEAVFDDFVQLGNPERDRTKGLGLGLSVVKRIDALLGLGLSLRSFPGKGSVFTLCLPLSRPPSAVATLNEAGARRDATAEAK